MCYDSKIGEKNIFWNVIMCLKSSVKPDKLLSSLDISTPEQQIDREPNLRMFVISNE